MKKLWMFMSVSALCLALMGCGGADENEETMDNNEENGAVDDTTTGETDETPDPVAEDEAILERADEAESSVLELEEVESATVVLTENNAYVAVEIAEGTTMEEDSEEFEQINSEIGDKVRETNADIENVYVSLNPDFVKQMNDYGDQIDAGEPVEGFFEEFNEAVQRMFPNAS